VSKKLTTFSISDIIKVLTRSKMNTLQMILIGVIAVVILVALYAIFVYNHVVTVKVRVDNAFSDILVQLKRRADLIPNLIETVKGYTKHESATLEAVVKARSSVLSASTPAEVAGAEKEMKSATSGATSFYQLILQSMKLE